MPKARHPDVGHHRTLLKNKPSSQKRDSGRDPSQDLFGARHRAAAGRRSGLAAGLVPSAIPVGGTGRSRPHRRRIARIFYQTPGCWRL